MVATKSKRASEEQLLGEIQTRIAGMQYYDSEVQPGEQVNLEREPENSHDENSIRVENGRFEPVGHLPRRLCSWLAPLVDSGKVRVDGNLPADSEDRKPSKMPLILSVFQCAKGKELLAKREVHTKLEALHEVVRRTYQDVQTFSNADLVLELVEGLQPLQRQELLPETRLRLALMPDLAREVGAAKAVVEEVDEDGEVPNLAVANNGGRPILIPAGEILVGAKQNRVVNITILVAARSRVILPVSCVEQGRWRYKSRKFQTTKHVAREFVQQVPDYCRLRTPTLGLGNELEIAGDGVVGAALLFSGQVCHLSAFSEKQ